MKQVYLIRHAKSSWNSTASSDFDRPLNDRGASDAPQMAEFLKTKGIMPDQMVSSSALRALTTSRILAKGLGVGEEFISADRRLYLSDVNQLQSIMREFSDDWNCVFVVGHNPTITDCANALAGDELDNIPTCGIYGVELEIDSWLKLRPGVGKKILFQVPKEL